MENQTTMNGHSCKLILSDIDQTILPWGALQVSERTRMAFHKVLDAHIPIGPVGGRECC